MVFETSFHTSLENMLLIMHTPHSGHIGYSWYYLALFS